MLITVPTAIPKTSFVELNLIYFYYLFIYHYVDCEYALLRCRRHHQPRAVALPPPLLMLPLPPRCRQSATNITLSRCRYRALHYRPAAPPPCCRRCRAVALLPPPQPPRYCHRTAAIAQCAAAALRTAATAADAAADAAPPPCCRRRCVAATITASALSPPHCRRRAVRRRRASRCHHHCCRCHCRHLY